MIKVIKQVHKEDVVLVKIGKFYNVYGKDAYIISDLFSYKIKQIEDNVCNCGFPEASLNKVMAKLEHEKINYIVVDKRNNYSKDEQCDNKNLNRYIKAYEKAHKNIAYKIRIERINQCLLSYPDKEKLRSILGKMEDIIKDIA